MRVYGRTTDLYGNKTWQVVQTDAEGFDDYVYATALAQCFKLNLGESPFFAQYGIPAKTSIILQLQPDYYVAFIQSAYSQFFASLLVAKRTQPLNDPTPIYDVYALRHNGSIYQFAVPI